MPKKETPEDKYLRILKQARSIELESSLRPNVLKKRSLTWTKGCKVKFETITPKMAYDLLTKHNKRNRPISMPRTIQIAQDILDGRWHPEVPDVICIGCDGNVKSAQHRLLAVVIAKIPVKMLVMRNCPEGAWQVIDSIRPRHAYHNMYMSGKYEVNARIQSTIKAMLSKSGRIKPTSMQKMQDIIKFYLEPAQFIERQIRAAGRCPKKIFVASVLGIIGRAWYICKEKGQLRRLGEFVKCMAIGLPVGLVSDDRAALVLREWLLTGKGATLGNRYTDKAIIYDTTMNSLKKFMEKENSKVARVTSLDHFPIPDYKEVIAV